MNSQKEEGIELFVEILKGDKEIVIAKRKDGSKYIVGDLREGILMPRRYHCSWLLGESTQSNTVSTMGNRSIAYFRFRGYILDKERL